MYTDALPPHSIDAEEAVLGSLLIDDAAWPKVKDWLKPEHFYRDRNRWCYEACIRLAQKGMGIDQVTLCHELDLMGKLDECGGPAYSSHLVAIIPTPLHAIYYARIVKECWERRTAIQRAGEMVADAQEGKRRPNQGVPLK